MTGPPAATAAIRLAVRRALADLPATAPVAAAVSGGADSLALAAALAFERPGAMALVVDHRLQPGSAGVAGRAADQCRGLGLDAAVLADPDPGADRPDPSPPGGPEARARELRYRLLAAAGERHGLAAVLLGHTLDDQAETVLLGLARGSGARALSGMAPVRDRYRRPLLGLTRAMTGRACAEAGLTPWQDPHNEDPSYARVRARRLLPELERALGPGTTAALARSAAQLREDADALDALADPTDEVPRLLAMPPALRARSLQQWAQARSGRALGAAHVAALRALVEDWHGQGPVALPGGGSVQRVGARLLHTPPR